MGKKARKGRASPSSNQTAMIPKKVNELPGQDVEVAVASVAEKKSCVHFDKGVKLDTLLDKIKSSEQIKCGECKEGVHMKRGSKGKVNSGKKGFSSSDAKSAKKAIWVCLECGQFVCGGVGLPTGAQSHVVRHIRSTRHRLVIQWENPQLRWCFPCHSLLPVEKEDNGEKKDKLSELVKLMKEQSSNASASASASADTEDSCSASGSITSETKLEGVVSSSKEARDGYAVRGLVNLGNTCFFNSVLQNLLSLDQLREQFLKEDMSGGGPLVSSLKKIFAETKSETGLKSAINPRAFFGSVCSKAPQFRGYQQHDSHELLRCLLDGLSTEESSLRKKFVVSETDSTSTHQKPTLVDSLFGGEISSTVSCLECGHSSKVYEPFLDLSLPVPSKKHPPVKLQTVSRPKKAKVPPKKVPKYRAALDRTSTGKALVSSASCSIAPTSGHTDSGPVLATSSALTVCENQASEIATQTDTEFDSFWLDIIGPETSNSESDLVLQGNGGDNSPTTQAVGVVQSPEIPASTSVSLDYQTLVGGTETLLRDNDRSVKPETDPDEQDAGAMQSTEVAAASGISAEIDEAQVCSYPDLGQSSSSVNPWDDEELPLMVGDSQVLYMPYKDDVSYDDKAVAEVNGEASSSSVSGHHEQIVDYVDFSSFFEEPDVSCNDKTVGDGKGEASSSYVSGRHEESADDLDFGSLFDEPEISEGPVFGPPSKAEVSEASFMAISSDSDPEELDDSDAPVSVDRCLAQFTKPEILSDDNAWHCENCSRNLKLQRLKEKRKLKESSELINSVNGLVNENGASSASNECRDSPSSETCTNNENGYKEAVPNTELTNCKEEKNVMDDGILGDSGVSAMKEPLSAPTDIKDHPATDIKDHPATEAPIVNGETISSTPANGIEPDENEDEAVDSEKVIVKRDATKRVLLNKAPPVLTVHLKRFSQDARGRLSKLSGHVAFQEFIDLRQYMDSRWTGEDQPVYRLAGLIEHSGTMRGGHYVSYIRGGHKVRRNSDDKEPDHNNSAVWYHASDSYVRRASLEEVLRSEAYILFYERI